MDKKNLKGLGKYIERIITDMDGDNYNAAARKLGISAGELLKIRKGERQSPNPAILKQIAEKFNGNYVFMLKLCGYAPTSHEHFDVVSVPVVENVFTMDDLKTNVVESIQISRAWLNPEYEYFIIRETIIYYEKIIAYNLARIDNRVKGGEFVIVSCDGNKAESRYIFNCCHGYEILSFFPVPVRTKTECCTIYGIIEKTIMNHSR